MGRYEVLETVAIADCALAVEGTDLDDLFTTAARALAELMVDPATLTPSLERRVVLEAVALDLLLFDWLNELIGLKDSEGAAFPGVEVQVEQGPPWRLRARLVGGPLHGGTAALRADPKAVTFHLFRVEPWAGGWRARVVIDI
ncbi:MAG TPA: archease [Methylomirabilota bacterium]|jgi:SHS2 domain-containing protein